MDINNYWIVRMDSDNYRIFKGDKNARPYIESLNLLSTGKSLSEIWESVFLSLYPGDDEIEGDTEHERNQPVPDFADGIFGLAMNEKAHSILQPLIADQAIFLKLNTEVGLYYELDIQKVNCLDVAKSIVKRFSSGGIMRVVKYSFYWEKIANLHIFCIPEVGRWNPVFVSNQFMEMVEVNNLTGLTFHPVPLVDE
jgi:hypothetical protein